ncbi:hypothetical protein TNCV_135021 [Trichonephila clavipes]|nr:hypothetical protein TNCV_135021 [Trichonephila clavipes]
MTSSNHMCCHSFNGYQEPFFQQDNARPHTAKVSQDCLRTVTTLLGLPDPQISLQSSISGIIWDEELDSIRGVTHTYKKKLKKRDYSNKSLYLQNKFSVTISPQSSSLHHIHTFSAFRAAIAGNSSGTRSLEVPLGYFAFLPELLQLK